MTWLPLFVDGPLGDEVAASEIDYRLIDRSSEPPEVLYLEQLGDSRPSYRAIEPPLPWGRVICMYRLVRVDSAGPVYEFVGATSRIAGD